jgi:predicted AlkP superfamily phosphohydrolase/phosphomutase
MRTLIIGLDAFDPDIFERLFNQGRMEGLRKYEKEGGYARFTVSNPSQSEVSWTSIATGLNPGEHGIFDFVHRDPKNYSLYVSLLPTKNGFAGRQFVPPFSAKTIFDQAIQKGYPSTSLWWPATFPAKLSSPVQTIPGLGTPDIHGKLGVGILFSTDQVLLGEKLKTTIELLQQRENGIYFGHLSGPSLKKIGGLQETSLELKLELLDDKRTQLSINEKVIQLEDGKWSPIIELTFKYGYFFKLKALTRVIISSRKPDIKLYFLPLQLHPFSSPWPYSTPRSFIKKTWHACGPFLTLGWPQDTVGLEEGCISDNQFLDLCDSIYESRRKVLWHHLQNFQEGLLSIVFDSLDRIQHMFWRQQPDVIERWYLMLDALVSQVGEYLDRPNAEPTKLIIVSDHGFTDFDYKVDLNRWLIEHGYMTSQEPVPSGDLNKVDWSKTQAYAIGLNSLYLNLTGREGQGIINTEQEGITTQKLRDDLLNWRGPNNRQVIKEVYINNEAINGSLANYGPDLLIGYSPGFRASSTTGLGEWGDSTIEINKDHWSGDHCIDPATVPGVIFSNQDMREFPNPSYLDIPELTLGEKMLTNGSISSPPPFDGGGDEDDEIIKERLKGLGYL